MEWWKPYRRELDFQGRGTAKFLVWNRGKPSGALSSATGIRTVKMNIWIGGDVEYVEVGGEQQAEWVGKNPERRVTITENQAEILSYAACVEVNGGSPGDPETNPLPQGNGNGMEQGGCSWGKPKNLHLIPGQFVLV